MLIDDTYDEAVRAVKRLLQSVRDCETRQNVFPIVIATINLPDAVVIQSGNQTVTIIKDDEEKLE